MNFNREENKLREEFFRNYRGRYSRFWIERWGIIPELPTSFDNANSIYELIAWLQRAFKNLLDDFQQLESELEDFKNALIELLEYLVPELIRRYHASKEFRELFIRMLKDLLQGELKEWFKELLRQLLKEPDMVAYLKELLKELLSDPTFLQEIKQILGITQLENRVNTLETKVATLESKVSNLETRMDNAERKNQQLEQALMKLITNLTNSGAWAGGLAGGLVEGRNLATGNINVFAGTADGSSFIRTNNRQTENDLAGGI